MRTGDSSLLSASQTLQFSDASGTNSVGFGPSKNDDLFTNSIQTYSLSEFFARPIQVFSTTWTPGASLNPLGLTVQFNPWQLFLENPRVINRLINYRNLRCNLRVKFMINGNQFYFGRILVSYHPLHLQDSFNVTTSDAVGLCCNSQRMSGFLDPCSSESLEFKLPFVWPFNYVSIPDKYYNELGTLHLTDFSILRHANSGTDPITITAYAWAEDVELECPTTAVPSGVLPQCDTEDDQGLISAPASAISGVADKLADVPVIGSYARATSMLAKSVSGVAKAFGYSRPSALANPQGVDVNYVPKIVNFDGEDNSVKLTADRMQELSIDPATYGVDTGDELAISSIASRKSFIYSMVWADTVFNGDPLMRLVVNPNISVRNGPAIALPAVSFATYPFAFWRGALKYTFQVVCSGLHRGRLLIQYDPFQAASVEPNVTISKVVDISTDKEFSITVPYSQPQQYLPLSSGAPANSTVWVSTGAGLALAGNGQLLVTVLNQLTSPAGGTTIYVNVFIEACPDYEVSVLNHTYPRGMMPTSFFVPQGDSELVDGTPREDMLAGGCDTGEPMKNLTYFGEVYPSFRAALKRYVLSNAYSAPSNTSPSLVSYSLCPLPLYPGKSKWSFTQDNSTTPVPTNFAPMTLIHYLMGSFLGWKGGVRNTFVVDNIGALNVLTVERSRNYAAESRVVTTNTSASSSQTANFYANSALKLAGGGALCLPKQRSSLSVESPYYSNRKWSTARSLEPTYSSFQSAERLNVFAHLAPSATTTTATIMRYTAVAEDFSLFWYQHPPVFTATPVFGTPSATV